MRIERTACASAGLGNELANVPLPSCLTPRRPPLRFFTRTGSYRFLLVYTLLVSPGLEHFYSPFSTDGWIILDRENCRPMSCLLVVYKRDPRHPGGNQGSSAHESFPMHSLRRQGRGRQRRGAARFGHPRRPNPGTTWMKGEEHRAACSLLVWKHPRRPPSFAAVVPRHTAAKASGFVSR